jgi:hypothetical protein
MAGGVVMKSRILPEYDKKNKDSGEQCIILIEKPTPQS